MTLLSPDIGKEDRNNFYLLFSVFGVMRSGALYLNKYRHQDTGLVLLGHGLTLVLS